MNLVYGEIVEVFSEDDMLVGRIRVHGATRKIPLGLLTDAVRGDRVLICDGVAISKVTVPFKTEVKHVSGDSREAH
jgi:hydrogenase maturation factor